MRVSLEVDTVDHKDGDPLAAAPAAIAVAVHLPGPTVPAWTASLLTSLLGSPELRVVAVKEESPPPAKRSLPRTIVLWDALITRRSRKCLPDALAGVLWRDALPQLADLPVDAPHHLRVDLAGTGARKSVSSDPEPPFGSWCYEFQSSGGDDSAEVSALETLTGATVTTYAIRVHGWLGAGPPAPFFRQDTSGWARDAQVDTHSLSLAQNRNEVLWHAATFLPQAVGAAVRLGLLKAAWSTSTPAVATTSPAPASTRRRGGPSGAWRPGTQEGRPTRFLALLPLHVARVSLASLRRAFCREQWILLWEGAQGPSASESAPRHRLQPPRDRFWADPHILEFQDDIHLFVEELPFATGRGRVALLTRGANGLWTKPSTVLEEPYHLSNPFVFEWEGGHYMVPESMASGDVRLYRSGESLRDWHFEKVLMRDVRAADATLVEHDGRWWMFATVAHFDWTLPNYELHIFSSDSPVGEEWRAHLANPVCVHAERARPAGAFVVQGGRLLRPAQDCSRGYGRAIRLMEVLELSERAYAEREIARLLPDGARGVRATHTVAWSDGLRVQDGLILQSRLRRSKRARS